jgi:hypothetical protein
MNGFELALFFEAFGTWQQAVVLFLRGLIVILLF